MTLDEASKSIGKAVWYLPQGEDLPTDEGTIEDVRGTYVFVLYPSYPKPVATYAADLRLKETPHGLG